MTLKENLILLPTEEVIEARQKAAAAEQKAAAAEREAERLKALLRDLRVQIVNNGEKISDRSFYFTGDRLFLLRLSFQ